MVDSNIMFTTYGSEWVTNIGAVSLNVGVTTFGPKVVRLTLRFNLISIFFVVK